MEKLVILDEYGYRKDPFALVKCETSDSQKIKRIVSMAIESRAMVSIVALRGQGKTEALSLALSGRDIIEVRLMTADKEKVGIGDIERALMKDIAPGENIKRTREIRARQIRRVVGEASREKPIVLIIEEAHRMHAATLRSLKTLREMDWMGIYPLFTVLLIGQYDPMRKPGVDEVRLRTDTFIMRGLTNNEIKDYIHDTVGKCFEPDAMEAIARRQNARNYLELQEMLIMLMGRALEVGLKKVTSLEVFELFGGGLKEVMKRTGTSLTDIEKETGLSRTTLSLVTNEKQGTLTDDKFSETHHVIADVLRKKIEGDHQPLKAVHQ